MALSNQLIELKKLDNCEQFDSEVIPIFIHDKHRFCLPIANYLINQNHYQPFDLVLFDAHTDACEPEPHFYDYLSDNIQNATNTIEICNKYLAKLNDDWVIAGMELGLINNAHVVGIQIPSQCEPDHYVSKMLDNIGKHQLTYCHIPLDWGKIIKDKLSFESIINQNTALLSSLRRMTPVIRPIWVNMDIDCFVEPGNTPQKPWSDEMLKIFFKGNLFKHLINQASLVTISKTFESSRFNHLLQQICYEIRACYSCHQ